MLSGGLITSLLNNRGKKVTMIFGGICLGAALPIFGLAVYFSKYVFLVICIISRLFIGFGSGAIGSASNSIIAFNYPDKMAKLISINSVICFPLNGIWPLNGCVI